MLLYGMPGVGKTTLAATAGQDILFVDVEKGTRSLRNYPSIAKNCRVFQPKDFAEVAKLMSALTLGEVTCETLVIDTISELSRKLLEQRLNLLIKSGKRPESVPYQGDYRLLTLTMQAFAEDLQNLPCNVIVVAHELTEQDDTTKILETRPTLTPKVLETFEALTDVQACLTSEVTKDGIKRELQVVGTRRLHAKNRMGHVRPIQDPTWEKLHTTPTK
jgi:phage nucleotide-binding protein